MSTYKDKYIKYKNKYLELKYGGMNRQGYTNKDNGQNKTTLLERKTDLDVWKKRIGLKDFMDLNKHKRRSTTALKRDVTSILPHINSDVIRMLGFPTSCERLLEWLRTKGGGDFEDMKIKQLGELKVLNLESNKLTSLPKEIGDLKQLKELYLKQNQLTSLPKEIGDLGENVIRIDGGLF